MSNGERRGNDGALDVREAKPKVAQPPLYKVVLLNDDYTPMEFVVHVLERFFGLDRERATQVMLHVHTRGKSIHARLRRPRWHRLCSTHARTNIPCNAIWK